jgi:hypothetical protein
LVTIVLARREKHARWIEATAAVGVKGEGFAKRLFGVGRLCPEMVNAVANALGAAAAANKRKPHGAALLQPIAALPSPRFRQYSSRISPARLLL